MTAGAPLGLDLTKAYRREARERADILAERIVHVVRHAIAYETYRQPLPDDVDERKVAAAAVLAAAGELMQYLPSTMETTMATNTTTTSGMPQSACNSTNTGGPAGSGMKTAGGSVKTIDPKPGGTKITKVGGGGPSKNYSY